MSTEISPGLTLQNTAAPQKLGDYKLIAFDMDSTLITIECIDEIADVTGKKAEVAAITEATMRGEITDFKDSLRQRVGKLVGVTEADMARVLTERLRLTPGADTLVRAEGTDAFRARITQQAQPLADYFFQQLTQEADPRSLEGKAHLMTLAAPLIDKIPGANLRTLMRQRLSEITGLSNDNSVSPASRSTPASQSSAAPDYPDYSNINTGQHDSPPDYGDIADYAHYIEPPAADFEPQKTWTKKGDGKSWGKDKPWKKGERNDQPRAPRKPVSVESPTLTALRTLLHHPALAHKVEDASHFAAEDDTYAQLLVALLGALQKNPKLRSLQLIARWHGTEQGRLLQALAEKEWLISADSLEQQFFDTITRLAARQRERSLEHLLLKARQSELSAEEKDQLRNLLSRNTAVITSPPTGA